MFRNKFLSVVLFAAVAAGVVISCNDDDKDHKAEGKKAGKEMCDCVASYEAPTMPNHPASPSPPAGLNLQELLGLDLQNPEVLAGLEPEVLAYLMNPAIQQYLGALGQFAADFETYAMKLGACPGVLAKYQQYVSFIYENYDPTATEPLYSVFVFKNNDFAQGFKEGTSDCMETFAALFALMGSQ
jgi:hypothetical protein